MPSDTVSTPVAEAPQKLLDEVLALVRRLVVTALLAGVGYSVASSASQGYCPGGFDADGGFVDRLGQRTEVAPSCINMTLRPSPVVYLVLALIVVWAVSSSARRMNDRSVALAVLRWAGPTVVLVAVLAVVLTHVAFFSIPLESWDPGAGAPTVPDWLAVDIFIRPMQNG